MTGQQVLGFYKNDVYRAAMELRVTPATVYNWCNNGIAMHRQRMIEDMTGGKLKAEKIKFVRAR